MKRDARSLSLALALLVAACAPLQPAPEPPPPPQPSPPPAAAPPAPEKQKPAPTLQQRGRVSLYGVGFAGKRTASGAIFDPDALTMAHPTLPFGTHVRVTNLANQKSVEVVVNDRGPNVRGRIADLSAGAAHQIGMSDGVIDALIEVVQPAD